MYILILLSLFFIWLVIKEIFPSESKPEPFDSFSVIFILFFTSLAFVAARAPYQYWKLERNLSEVAAKFAEVESVDMHCNGLFESVFYEGYSYGSFTMAGLAFFEERKIILQYPWCRHLINYLESPEEADQKQRFSLQVYVHEIMHIKGERNEVKTECQAIQRGETVAIYLGVPESTAREHAVQYYKEQYPLHPYFSPNCAPGGELDEKLWNPTW